MVQTNLMSFEERKNIVMHIADDMAAAASSMSAQNYDVLMQCREKLSDYIVIWAKQDIARHEMLRRIRTELEENDSKL